MSEFDVKISNQGAKGSTKPASSTPASEKPTIKDIFEQKITREELEKYGNDVLAMFDQYNKADKNGVKDNIIDQNEYNAYLKANKKDDTSSKRTAENGYYTAVKGDTLSAIAKDFGFSVIELYAMNKKVIGNDINHLMVGMKIAVTRGVTQSSGTTSTKGKSTSKNNNSNKGTTTTDFSSPTQQKDGSTSVSDALRSIAAQMKPKEEPVLFKSMTKGQAEQMGCLDKFLEYSSDGKTITQTDLLKYNKAISGMTLDKAFEVMPSLLGKEKLDTKDLSAILRSGIGLTISQTGVGKSEKSAKIREQVELTIASHDRALSSASTNEEIAEHSAQLFEELKGSIEADLKDENGIYQTTLNRYKKGEFTELERKLKIDQRTPEQQEEFALRITKAEYILPILESVATALEQQNENGEQDNTLMLLLMNLGDKFFEQDDVLAVAQMTGLLAVIDAAKQIYFANQMATNSSLDTEAMSEGVAALYTGVLANTADADAFAVFVENHQNSIDLINKVVQQVIENTDDPNKKDALSGIMDKYNTTSTETVLTGEAARVADTRAKSEEYNEARGLTPLGSHETQTAKHSAHRISMELDIPEPIRYNPDRIRRLVQDYNNSFNNFDSLPREDQEKLKLYLAGAPTHALVSMIVSGNSNTQKFIMDYITTELISRTINADDHQKLITQIKDRLSALIMSRVQAGTLTPEQMTDTERVIYEYAQQNA